MKILSTLFPKHFRKVTEQDIIEAMQESCYVVGMCTYLEKKYAMSHWWSPFGQIYSLLDRLESSGRIRTELHAGTKSRGIDPETGAPRRRKAYFLAD